MPVPSTISELSTTPGSNSPAGSESPALMDDYLRTAFAFIKTLDNTKLAAIPDGSISTTKIVDDAVTLAKLQNIATGRFLGRTTAGSGDVEELTGPNLFAAIKQAATEAATGVVELATTAEASAGTDTTRAVTAAGVEAHMTANAFGWGQSWQDVTSSRASGTTYTNTTGKPIMVAVSSAFGTSCSVVVVVAGAEITRQTMQVGGSVFLASASFVVPPGATYSVTASPSISNWRELR